MNICQICGENPADIEDNICFRCKGIVDQEHLEDEIEPISRENHRGEYCWVNSLTICSTSNCKVCSIYRDSSLVRTG